MSLSFASGGLGSGYTQTQTTHTFTTYLLKLDVGAVLPVGRDQGLVLPVARGEELGHVRVGGIAHRVEPLEERLVLLAVRIVSGESPKFRLHTRAHRRDVLNVQHRLCPTRPRACVALARHGSGVVVLPALELPLAEELVERL